ncbi:UPF0175 family protein [Candidatus Woesearchaeota archaeon]|nr:UPF0175 family protein [Candidatus Woesearchaeota archaeon]
MTQAETVSLSDMMSLELKALIKCGIYTSKSDVVRDAMRCLYTHQPTLKLNIAIELYKEGEVSIGKAAEIAGMSTVDFKEILAERGLVKDITLSKERVKKGLELLKRIRR